MVSEIRRKKLLRVFEFMDTDKSGTINKADFDLALEKLARNRKWTAGDAKFNEAQQTTSKIWQGIQSHPGLKNAGEVSSDEWVTLWDFSQGTPKDFQILYCKFTFSLLDAGNDGKIDSDDYLAVITSSGRVSKEEATTAFQKLSKGKSAISFEDYQELWKEYHVSEDPNAPGNYLFGRLTVS